MTVSAGVSDYLVCLKEQHIVQTSRHLGGEFLFSFVLRCATRLFFIIIIVKMNTTLDLLKETNQPPSKIWRVDS